MYQYTACGLDNIWLKNGYEISESPDGRGVSIHDLDSLHKLIADGVVNKPAPLNGKEFRFLRMEMDLSQKAVGDLMDKTDQMIARWEKGSNAVPVLADVAIRNLYMESIGKTPIAGLLKELSNLDRQLHELKIELEETQQGWKYEACA